MADYYYTSPETTTDSEIGFINPHSDMGFRNIFVPPIYRTTNIDPQPDLQNYIPYTRLWISMSTNAPSIILCLSSSFLLLWTILTDRLRRFLVLHFSIMFYTLSMVGYSVFLSFIFDINR
eukprot:sb/3476172/